MGSSKAALSTDAFRRTNANFHTSNGSTDMTLWRILSDPTAARHTKGKSDIYDYECLVVEMVRYRPS